MNYFDLEDPATLSRLTDPMPVIQPLEGLVIIDEIQTRPELFPVIKTLSDRRPLPARFLLISSGSPRFFGRLSETLRGKAEMLTISGFNYDEAGVDNLNRHWLRGGFPLSYIAESDDDSIAWRRNFITHYLDDQITKFDKNVSVNALSKVLQELSHLHGQIFDVIKAADSLSLSESTLSYYLDLLDDLFLIRRLQPFSSGYSNENSNPKILLRDSGLLHHFLGITSTKELLDHSCAEASWKGYIIEEALRIIGPDEAYFYNNDNEPGIDLVLFKNGYMHGIKIVRSDLPLITPSMLRTISDTGFEKISIIYSGINKLLLNERVEAIPVSEINRGIF